MTYEESEIRTVTLRQVMTELKAAGVCAIGRDDFFNQFGSLPRYNARQVLDWIADGNGYL